MSASPRAPAEPDGGRRAVGARLEPDGGRRAAGARIEPDGGRRAAGARLEPARGRFLRLRVPLAGGASTTVYVACHPLATTEVRVFVPPWGAMRACVHVQGGMPRILHRDELPARPRGDLLQAGPLLVRDGERVYDRRHDPEGFSAAAHQFDSDITDGRHPRAALGLTDRWMFAVACDGRARGDAGLTLGELANLLVRLGCRDALNLDGGGSTSLVAGGRLRNRPRGDWERPERGGRPVATALVFAPRE
jgi:hypothetical protein